MTLPISSVSGRNIEPLRYALGEMVQATRREAKKEESQQESSSGNQEA